MATITSKANKLPSPKMEALCVILNGKVNDVLTSFYKELRDHDMPADRAHAIIESGALRSYYDTRKLTQDVEAERAKPVQVKR